MWAISRVLFGHIFFTLLGLVSGQTSGGHGAMEYEAPEIVGGHGQSAVRPSHAPNSPGQGQHSPGGPQVEYEAPELPSPGTPGYSAAGGTPTNTNSHKLSGQPNVMAPQVEYEAPEIQPGTTAGNNATSFKATANPNYEYEAPELPSPTPKTQVSPFQKMYAMALARQMFAPTTSGQTTKFGYKSQNKQQLTGGIHDSATSKTKYAQTGSNSQQQTTSANQLTTGFSSSFGNPSSNTPSKVQQITANQNLARLNTNFVQQLPDTQQQHSTGSTYAQMAGSQGTRSGNTFAHTANVSPGSGTNQGTMNMELMKRLFQKFQQMAYNYAVMMNSANAYRQPSASPLPWGANYGQATTGQQSGGLPQTPSYPSSTSSHYSRTSLGQNYGQTTSSQTPAEMTQTGAYPYSSSAQYGQTSASPNYGQATTKKAGLTAFDNIQETPNHEATPFGTSFGKLSTYQPTMSGQTAKASTHSATSKYSSVSNPTVTDQIATQTIYDQVAPQTATSGNKQTATSTDQTSISNTATFAIDGTTGTSPTVHGNSITFTASATAYEPTPTSHFATGSNTPETVYNTKATMPIVTRYDMLATNQATTATDPVAKPPGQKLFDLLTATRAKNYDTTATGQVTNKQAYDATSSQQSSTNQVYESNSQAYDKTVVDQAAKSKVNDPIATSQTVKAQIYDPTSQPATAQLYDSTSTSQTATAQLYDPTATSQTATAQLYDPTATSQSATAQLYDTTATGQTATVPVYDPTVTSQTSTAQVYNQVATTKLSPVQTFDLTAYLPTTKTSDPTAAKDPNTIDQTASSQAIDKAAPSKTGAQTATIPGTVEISNQQMSPSQSSVTSTEVQTTYVSETSTTDKVPTTQAPWSSTTKQSQDTAQQSMVQSPVGSSFSFQNFQVPLSSPVPEPQASEFQPNHSHSTSAHTSSTEQQSTAAMLEALRLKVQQALASKIQEYNRRQYLYRYGIAPVA